MSMVDPTWFERQSTGTKVGIVAGSLIAIALIVAIAIYVLFGNGRNDKNEQLESDIDRGKGQVDIISNQNAAIENAVNAQGSVVNAKGNNTNQAANDLRKSVNRPSNQFDGNRAGQQFCVNFPNDPSCR